MQKICKFEFCGRDAAALCQIVTGSSFTKGVFLVYVPDMNIYTEGTSFVDAIEMARDAIGLKGIDIEDDGK